MRQTKVPFRPKLMIRHTGFSGPNRFQWIGKHLIDDNATIGLHCVDEFPIAQAMELYISALAHMKRRIIRADGTILNLADHFCTECGQKRKRR